MKDNSSKGMDALFSDSTMEPFDDGWMFI